MSADADKRGTLAARQGSHKRPQHATPRPVVRKPVPKQYGAKATYAETKFERERRERRERTA